MVLRRFALAVGLAAVLPRWPEAAEQLRGAIVRGRVELPRVQVTSERRPVSAELGEGSERDAGEWRRAVVYFETAPKGAFEDREAGRAC